MDKKYSIIFILILSFILLFGIYSQNKSIGRTIIEIPIPCEAIGQIVNGKCEINSTITYYRDFCLDNSTSESKIDLTINRYSNIKKSKKEIFNGFFYGKNNIYITYKNDRILPDYLLCNDYINYIETIVGNYTYFTNGSFPVLVPVKIDLEFINVTCSIKNLTIYGEYNDINSCNGNYTNLMNDLEKVKVYNLTGTGCYISGGKYMFNINGTYAAIIRYDYFNFTYKNLHIWMNVYSNNLKDFCKILS
ncbi:MAG: hypothetical protein ACP5G1_02525 [Nanopusillaceae archaeon]